MKRKIIIGLAVVLVIQAAWLVFWGQYISERYTKTSAAVIEVRFAGKAEQYPIYEFYDNQGRRHVDDDRFNDKIKKTNPLYPIFGRDVGDKVNVYYTKDNPAEMMVLANAGSLITLLAPLIFLPQPFVVYYVVLLLIRFRSFNRSTGRFE